MQRITRLLTLAMMTLACCTLLLGWQLRREGQWNLELERRVLDTEMEILKLKRVIKHGNDILEPPAKSIHT